MEPERFEGALRGVKMKSKQHFCDLPREGPVRNVVENFIGLTSSSVSVLPAIPGASFSNTFGIWLKPKLMSEK